MSADKAAELLRGLRARDTAAKTLRALARDLISEVRQLDRRIAKAANDIQNSPDWGARRVREEMIDSQAHGHGSASGG